MYSFIALAIIAATSALDCGPETCAVVGLSLPLQCKGSIIKNGGFCGCYDVCAKQAGESCQARPGLDGRSSYGTCEPGLICVPHGEMVSLGYGRCHIPRTPRFLDTFHNPSTPCEEQRRARLLSMVVWVGQWTPVCDHQGNFVPHQCDNNNSCFCVDTHSGKMLTEKSLGQVDCNGGREATQEVASASALKRVPSARFLETFNNPRTPCEEQRRARLMSMVVWQGQWVPVCDSQGNYVSHQCDNMGQCFCVETHSGKMLTEKSLGEVNCVGHVVQNVVSAETPKRTLVARLLDVNLRCDLERKERLSYSTDRPGEWIPVCDDDGNYVPHQCTNIGRCFCVDKIWGSYLKVSSSDPVDCSANQG